MKTISLASFNDMESARMLRDRLEAAGIQSEVHDESNVHKYLFLTEPLAAAKIEVAEQDFTRARELIEQLDLAEDSLHYAVRCPQCRSPRVEYPQFYTRKFNLPALVEIATMKTGLVEKDFYCVDCHHTWPKEVIEESEKDILNWPKEEKQ